MPNYLNSDVGIQRIVAQLRQEHEPHLSAIEQMLQKVAALGECKVLISPPKGTHAGSIHVRSAATGRLNAFFAIITEHHHNHNPAPQEGNFKVQAHFREPLTALPTGWEPSSYSRKSNGSEWLTYSPTRFNSQEAAAIHVVVREARRSFE